MNQLVTYLSKMMSYAGTATYPTTSHLHLGHPSLHHSQGIHSFQNFETAVYYTSRTSSVTPPHALHVAGKTPAFPNEADSSAGNTYQLMHPLQVDTTVSSCSDSNR